MKIVLDTNVFISGVFFTGPPHKILEAWRDGKVALVLSPEIMEEYYRAGQALQIKFPETDITPILSLLTVEAELILVPPLPEGICEDPDDDKFLACAIATNTEIIISGDKKLLAVSGCSNIRVISPRTFVEEYLS